MLRSLVVSVAVTASIAATFSASAAEAPGTPESQRVEVLERRLTELEKSAAADLRAEQERRIKETEKRSQEQQALLKDISDQNYRVLVWVLGLGGVLGLISAFRSMLRERESEKREKESEKRAAELHERAEKRTAEQYERTEKRTVEQYERAEKRTAALHEEVTRIAKAHADAAEVAAKGAGANVQTLTNTLESFQAILRFKVMEAQHSAEQLDELNERMKDLDLRERGQIEALVQEAKDLRRSRHVYTNPEPTLRRQLEEFARRFDLLPKEVIERFAKTQGERSLGPLAELHLRRGIVAYFDNDPVRARRVLETASEYSRRAREAAIQSGWDERGEAFVEFYLALIHKNYGEQAEAQRHIELSYELYGKDGKTENAELLTRTTRAEIRSYGSNTSTARDALQELIKKGRTLKKLAPHDEACLARCMLMLGNTYYVDGEWYEAMKHYEDALGSNNAAKYYVLYSQALVLEKIGQDDEARKKREEAYAALKASGHLETKKALDTQLSLHALGQACSPNDTDALRHFETIHETYSRIHDHGDLQLRLFSFEKKKQIAKSEWMADLSLTVGKVRSDRTSVVVPKALPPHTEPQGLSEASGEDG
jgi:hypothetical protein